MITKVTYWNIKKNICCRQKSKNFYLEIFSLRACLYEIMLKSVLYAFKCTNFDCNCEIISGVFRQHVKKAERQFISLCSSKAYRSMDFMNSSHWQSFASKDDFLRTMSRHWHLFLLRDCQLPTGIFLSLWYKRFCSVYLFF